MTKDQIDELMRENGIVIVGEAVYALCNLVEEQSAAAEREACAKELEKISNAPDIQAYAAAIRARGQ
jgi:hypothetical protein